MKINIRGETVKTERTHRKIRVRLEREAQEPIDPEALWGNPDIEPEELVQVDPLDITPELVEHAEHPELADYNLQSLPVRRFWLSWEHLEWKAMKVALQQKHGYVARLPDSVLASWRKGSS